MSTHRLDTVALIRDIDRRRGARSYRQVAEEVGVSPSTLTRLARGQAPAADALCSLLMWLNPKIAPREYILTGDRRAANRVHSSVGEEAARVETDR